MIVHLREFNRFFGSNIIAFLCDVEPGPVWLQCVDGVLHGLERNRGRFIKVTAACNVSISEAWCAAMGPDDDLPEEESDAIKFGRLVRTRRNARGWSLEALAAEALLNSTRKGYVSLVERGEVPNIERETVKKFARALEINPEFIPPSLRWPEATAAVRDTNSLVLETHVHIADLRETVEKLVRAQEDRARDYGIKEGMLIALAQRYADGSPREFESALTGLEQALKVARDERKKGRLPSSAPAAVDSIIARIDALNDAGDLDAGQAELDTELAAIDQDDTRRKAIRSRLYDKGIAQAILTRSIENACRFLLAKLDLDVPADPGKRWLALFEVQTEWLACGFENGLVFHLEVSIELAREALARASNADERGGAGTNLAKALKIAGCYASGTKRLEEAVEACHTALADRHRERVPLDWAETQLVLGDTLYFLALRTPGTLMLAQAVAAHRAALEEFSQEHNLQEWRVAQRSLGAALAMLGQREGGTTRLKEAAAASRASLDGLSRKQDPIGWGQSHNDLGIALRALGQLTCDTGLLKEAGAAYRQALKGLTRKDRPLEWALTQQNLGAAFLALGHLETETTWLKKAAGALREALLEQTKERVPFPWAISQLRLAVTEKLLAKRAEVAGDCALASTHRQRALLHADLALQVLTHEDAPVHYNALMTLRDELMSL